MALVSLAALTLTFCALALLVATKDAMPSYEIKFPDKFVFGVATAAYQIEGSWNEDGKGPSIWDNFSHIPGKVYNNENGDVADDHYHRVASDIDLIASLGVSHYRMSISWARIFPTGFPDKLNQPGVDHYVNELKALKAKGIKPFVTLYHWDLPQGLEDYGGWLNSSTVDAYIAYANTSFALFGEYVDLWATFNEPWVVSWLGYGTGGNAPGRCSNRSICDQGDSSTEPYLVGHNLLLAHAGAFAAYKRYFQPTQNGQIGIVINSDFAAPVSNSSEDVAAAQRYLEFTGGWFAHPVLLGDYPASMRKAAGNRLPKFTAAQKKALNGSADFLGLNHYTSIYAAAASNGSVPDPNGGWSSDMNVQSLRFKDGKQIGPMADSNWLYVVPWGMRGILNWLKATYNSPQIFVSENGVDSPQENLMPKEEALQDVFRQFYLKNYLENLQLAITVDKVDVKGYFLWSLMDNFEWSDGYQRRFGIVYVDYANNQTRTEKASANWYRQLIAFNAGKSPSADDAPLTGFWRNVVIGLAAGLGAALLLIIILIVVVAAKRKDKSNEYVPLMRDT